MPNLAFDHQNIARHKLQAGSFESLIARLGQDCIWLRNTPMPEEFAHDSAGRGIRGQRKDERATDWPKHTDWRSLQARLLSTGLYEVSGQVLAAVRSGALVPRQSELVRIAGDKDPIAIRAKTALTTEYAFCLTATQDGQLSHPDSLRTENAIWGLFADYTMEDELGAQIAPAG